MDQDHVLCDSAVPGVASTFCQAWTIRVNSGWIGRGIRVRLDCFCRLSELGDGSFQGLPFGALFVRCDRRHGVGMHEGLRSVKDVEGRREGGQSGFVGRSRTSPRGQSHSMAQPSAQIEQVDRARSPSSTTVASRTRPMWARYVTASSRPKRSWGSVRRPSKTSSGNFRRNIRQSATPFDAWSSGNA